LQQRGFGGVYHHCGLPDELARKQALNPPKPDHRGLLMALRSAKENTYMPQVYVSRQ